MIHRSTISIIYTTEVSRFLPEEVELSHFLHRNIFTRCAGKQRIILQRLEHMLLQHRWRRKHTEYVEEVLVILVPNVSLLVINCLLVSMRDKGWHLKSLRYNVHFIHSHHKVHLVLIISHDPHQQMSLSDCYEIWKKLNGPNPWDCFLNCCVQEWTLKFSF